MHILSASLHSQYAMYIAILIDGFAQLHSRCECVVVKDVPEILHALRVLAKFLGYLDFLPYSSVISPSLLPARTAPVSTTDTAYLLPGLYTCTYIHVSWDAGLRLGG